MKIFEGMHKYIWLEFGIWFFILCIAVFGLRIHNYHKKKALVTYQIFMPDVDGLIVGSPVKFMGVQVGYIGKIKIVRDEVYLKIVMTDKNATLPKGSIATVEFNGMGGSKSLEVYPPTKESIAMNNLIAVQSPKRLNDAMGLLSEMFDKIGSITTRLSFFANETGVTELNGGVDIDDIQSNMNILDKWIKSFQKIKESANSESTKQIIEKGVEEDGQIESSNNK